MNKKTSFEFFCKVDDKVYNVYAIDFAGGVYTCAELNKIDEVDFHISEIDKVWAVTTDEKNRTKFCEAEFYCGMESEDFLQTAAAYDVNKTEAGGY